MRFDQHTYIKAISTLDVDYYDIHRVLLQFLLFFFSLCLPISVLFHFAIGWLLKCLRITLIVCLIFLSNKLSLWAIYCQYYSFFIVQMLRCKIQIEFSFLLLVLFRFSNAHFRFCTSIAHHSLQRRKKKKLVSDAAKLN